MLRAIPVDEIGVTQELRVNQPGIGAPRGQRWILLVNPLTMPNLPGLKLTRMKRIALVVLLLSAGSEVHGGQGNQDRTNELTRLLEMPSCRRNSQSGQMVCEAVLSRPMDTKRNKVGDHILLRTDLVTGSAEAPITILDAAVVEEGPFRFKDSNRQGSAQGWPRASGRGTNCCSHLSIECHGSVGLPSHYR